MNATTLASRAVLSEYARKTLRPIEIGVVIVFILMTLGTTLLITQVSLWWWILMTLVVIYGIIGSIAWLVIHFTLDRIRPDQTKQQEKLVKQFVKSIDSMAGTLQTTQFGLLLRVIRDVMAKNDKNILTEFAHDSHQLKKEFQSIVTAFK